MKINKEKFFSEFRPFYKKVTGKRSLSVATANGVDFLLDQYMSNPLWSDVRKVSYSFSTVGHETAWTFLPIKEYRAASGTKSRKNQDRYWLEGYYGRGYVQLTWDYNYQKAGQKLGINLLENPDLALRNDIAFKIMTYGMHEGWFTGKKLSDYINNTKTDYVNARKIINGLDKAATIAGYAKEFERILRASIEEEDESLVKKTVSSQPTEPEPETTPPSPEDSGNANIDNPPADAGEAAPNDTARPGEPVVGGRPGDDATIIRATEAQPTSGWGAWAANIRAQWVSLGIGTASMGSIFSGLVTNPIFIYILIGLVVLVIVGGVVIYIRSMDIKSKEKMEREQRAHELTKLQVNVNADPTKYNVKVVN